MVKIVDIPAGKSPLDVSYDDDVIAVHESGKAGLIEVPTAELSKHKTRLRSAGAKLDKGIRILEVSDSETEGMSDIIFTVRERQVRPRGKSKGEDAPAE